MASGRRSADEVRTGVSGSGMAYATWGSGSRTLLCIPGGPGNAAPGSGGLARLAQRQLRQLTDAGFTVWLVTRPRGMPRGHTMADIADDYAAFVRDELGGQVEVAHGISFGGVVVQYLAARHPDVVDHVVVHCAACEASEQYLDVDLRWAQAVHDGDATAAAMALSEYFLPGDRLRPVRRLLAPVVGRFTGAGGGHESYREDMLVEAHAERYDSRDVLPRIQAPVLLVAGTADRCFPRPLVQETAALVPDCTLVWYAGQGHFRGCSNRHVGEDILAFVSRPPRRQSG
jgi:pimeloyl-ACP methyl ester carboxylesterase